MNELSNKSIFIGSLFLAAVVFISWWIASMAFDLWPFTAFKALVSILVFVSLFYVLGFSTFGLIFRNGKSLVGEVTPHSPNKFYVDMHVIFLLVFFDPIFFNPFLPAFFHNIFYEILGCKIGKNSYTAGIILDPQLVKIGNDTILGAESMIIPHLFYGGRTAFLPVEIGDGVTIGARAIIFGGARVEDGCILASGAILAKNSHMKKNEIWGGVPAKFIKMREDLGEEDRAQALP